MGAAGDSRLLVQTRDWTASLNRGLTDPVCKHKTLPRIVLKLELHFAKEVLYLFIYLFIFKGKAENL